MSKMSQNKAIIVRLSQLESYLISSIHESIGKFHDDVKSFCFSVVVSTSKDKSNNASDVSS